MPSSYKQTWGILFGRLPSANPPKIYFFFLEIYICVWKKLGFFKLPLIPSSVLVYNCSLAPYLLTYPTLTPSSDLTGQLTFPPPESHSQTCADITQWSALSDINLWYHISNNQKLITISDIFSDMQQQLIHRVRNSTSWYHFDIFSDLLIWMLIMSQR